MQSIPHSSHHSREKASPDAEQEGSQEPLCRMPAKAKKEPTQNSSTTNAADWWCLQSRLGAGGAKRPQPLSRQAPAILQHSVAAALTARWTATLTHAAMTPFAASLLGEATPNLYNVRSQSSQLEPNPGRSPDRPTPFQSTSSLSSTPVSTCMGPGLLPFVFLVCLETDQ